MAPKYFCFFDLETGGLDPQKDEIIQVAAIRTTLRLQVLDTFEAKVQFDVEKASSAALAINSYCEDAWRDAIPLKTALIRLQGMLSNAIPAGHNITGFDLPFLRAGWAKYIHLQPARMDYHALDTMHLAWPLWGRGVVPNTRLVTLCDYYDIKHDNAHDALGDVEATLEVARRLLNEL